MQRITVKTTASKGIALGEAFVVKRIVPDFSNRLIAYDEKSLEETRFSDAVKEASRQIGELAKTSDIFAAHLEIVSDDTLKDSVLSKINSENKNAEHALEEAKDEICSLFADIDDEYLRERVTDIKDVCSRIMKVLKGVTSNPFETIGKEVIIVADDLTPSDTALMDFTRVRGLITRFGGVTSHVCIIAKNKGIPAIAGVGNDFPMPVSGDFVILDGLDDEIIVNPDKETIARYQAKASRYLQQKDALLKYKNLEAETTDGHKVHVMANASSVEEITNAEQGGASGIGLFRSEFLYMQSTASFPDEETQFTAYKDAAEACPDKQIIIRTLDIGGDKSLPYFPFDKEENPFLGWRAIRVCLDRTDVFRTQLRALLRASAFGGIKIMFPMIISVEELRAAKAMVESCKLELRKEGLVFNENIETGVMIETPAAVFIAEELARESDFLSIGTNDLTQYTLAADRLNPKVSGLYNPFHPAVLRSIKMVADAANRHGKPIGMCGEMAGNPKAVTVLLGMGLTSFSVTASDIPAIKQQIRSAIFAQTQKLAEAVCQKSTCAEILALLGE